jgi:alcohol dehydrogenase class IV
MRFELATAARVIFGPGVWREVGPLARGFAPRALVVTGANPRRAEPLLSLLREHGVGAITFPVPGEPEIETVRQGVALSRQEDCGLVISFGGGSALDAGKAIAAMLANPGELLDYLEVIGRGKALAEPSVPFIAVPTTAGSR